MMIRQDVKYFLIVCYANIALYYKVMYIRI